MKEDLAMIDLTLRLFERKDVLRICRGLSPRMLDQWLTRGTVPVMEPHPALPSDKKRVNRRFSGMDTLAIAAVHDLGRYAKIPPASAAEILPVVITRAMQIVEAGRYLCDAGTEHISISKIDGSTNSETTTARCFLVSEQDDAVNLYFTWAQGEQIRMYIETEKSIAEVRRYIGLSYTVFQLDYFVCAVLNELLALGDSSRD